MPSSRSRAPRSLGIFLALVPWIAFAILVQIGSLTTASIAALIIAVLVAAPGVKSSRPKLIELGAVIVFALFSVIALASDPADGDFIVRYAQTISTGLLALLTLASLQRVPFTEQYAREQVPDRFWSSPQFVQTNRELTTMWAIVFALATASQLIAAVLDARAGDIAFDLLLPVLLLAAGVRRTTIVSRGPKRRKAAGEPT